MYKVTFRNIIKNSQNSSTYYKIWLCREFTKNFKIIKLKITNIFISVTITLVTLRFKKRFSISNPHNILIDDK